MSGSQARGNTEPPGDDWKERLGFISGTSLVWGLVLSKAWSSASRFGEVGEFGKPAQDLSEGGDQVCEKLEIQASETDAQFIQETANLGNYNDWIQAEREFRLCRSLRAAVRETETLSAKLAGGLSAATRSWT